MESSQEKAQRGLALLKESIIGNSGPFRGYYERRDLRFAGY